MHIVLTSNRLDVELRAAKFIDFRFSMDGWMNEMKCLDYDAKPQTFHNAIKLL